jgi:hypothetical protein
MTQEDPIPRDQTRTTTEKLIDLYTPPNDPEILEEDDDT